MPELTPTGAVDVVQRQVRRVRRRKNLYELQRAFYLSIAAVAAAATLLLPIALLASTDAFTIAVWSGLALLAGLGLVIVGRLRRHWLARTRTVAWIESRSALEGRVRTLVELAEQPATSRGFFHALLVEQIGRGLDAWTPRRLVPRAIPRGALAGALVMTTVLAAVLHLASLALPSAPSIGVGEQPRAGAATAPEHRREVAPGERIVVAPGVPNSHERPAPAAGGEPPADDSTLTQLSSALQEGVRRQVWGKAWERVREALARAATSRESAGGASTSEDGEETAAESSDEWEIARAPSGELTRRRRPGIGKQPSSRANDPTRPHDPADAESTSNAAPDEHEGGDGGMGAGNGIAPDLFGGQPVTPGTDGGSFELSLAARMRSDGTAGKTAGGPPPDAAPDARPVLAGGQRRESAAHRMAVPAAYEAVVREVFAHRASDTP